MGKKSGTCLYCGETKRFAKAHVISKTLFKDIIKRYGRAHLLNVTDLDRNNPVEDAFFDMHILCAECDRSFSSLEDYFVQLTRGDLLRNGKVQRKVRTDYGQYMVDTLSPVATLRLRQFYLLTLWRCSISKQDSFSALSLGAAEETVIRNLLQTNSPGDYADYATILISFSEVDDIRKFGAIAPANANIEGLPITMILFDGWAIIYCLKNQVHEWFFKHALTASENLEVIVLKERLGIELLGKLTHNNVHVREADVAALNNKTN